MSFESRFQIGKNGITPGFIDALNLGLKTHSNIRISILKSAERDRQKINEMGRELVEKVNYHCDYKIIGFTIILKKQSSKPKSKKLQEKSL